jgi:uncharacterized protein
VRSALVVLALAIAALYAFSRYARRSSMFFPSRDVPPAPAGVEEQWFTTGDGVKLHGWLFRSGSPLIVWLHGNGGSIAERAPMAAEFSRRGVSVFLAEYRGYGKSEGTATESGLYHDALAAYDHAAKIKPDIVIYGESLGGPYAAYVAKHRKVRCVIIENSFPSLLELGNALYAPIPLGWTAPRAMATRRWLNEAGVPVLVMHGRRDEVIPFRLGLSLYEGLKVPKQMFVSETSNHSEIPSVEGQRYYEAVMTFIH